MRLLLIVSCLLFSTGLARAQMVLNDSIGNDPAKEKLCASRARGKTYLLKSTLATLQLRGRSIQTQLLLQIDGASPQLV